MELITRVFDYTNTEAWPKIQANPHQLKIATIITLALIDEAVNPGKFHTKLALVCEKNNIPKINYQLEPNTAKTFFNALSGVSGDPFTQTSQQIQQHIPPKNTQSSQGHTGKVETQYIFKTGITQSSTLSKHSRDILGGKRAVKFQNDLDN